MLKWLQTLFYVNSITFRRFSQILAFSCELGVSGGIWHFSGKKGIPAKKNARGFSRYTYSYSFIHDSYIYLNVFVYLFTYFQNYIYIYFFLKRIVHIGTTCEKAGYENNHITESLWLLETKHGVWNGLTLLIQNWFTRRLQLQHWRRRGIETSPKQGRITCCTRGVYLSIFPIAGSHRWNLSNIKTNKKFLQQPTWMEYIIIAIS